MLLVPRGRIASAQRLQNTNLRHHYETRLNNHPDQFEVIKPEWSVQSLLEGKSTELVQDERIERLAQLSNIAISKEDTKRFRTDIDKMLVFVGHIQQSDTEGVRPLYSLLEDQKLQLREDKQDAVPLADITKNASVTHRGFFVAPRSTSQDNKGEVIEEEE
eukprot:TRINITY_DN3369_c0_g1_i1.p1 TRINITY_DN3369_c0_g1~~TRINITY_DN3369_c0_g1_i1.p1  ORF type:complete len:161 (+),score=18.49 TRINITY_DN3369_c0_g1_i1:18-500(+)